MISRRAFLGVVGGAPALLAPRPAPAEEAFTVAVVLPPPSPAATALQQGALLGLDDANALAVLFGKRLALRIETAAGGAAVAPLARALARGEGALGLLGGAGPGFADALRDVAAAEGVLFLNASAPDDRLRNDRCDGQSFHLAPSVSMLVDTLALWLAGRQRRTRWAIAGDGGALARETEAAARRALARRSATVVPEAAGPNVLLLAGDGEAVRQALERARRDGSPAVAAIGGDVPEALGPDGAAGVWSVGWHHELERFSARELNARFRRRFAGPMTEVAWASWAAVKMVGEAVVRGGATGPAAVRAFLELSPPFDGHKGTALTFRRWDHQLRQPLYVIGPRRREEVTGRRGPFQVLADLPGPDLDAIGTPAAESRCRLGT